MSTSELIEQLEALRDQLVRKERDLEAERIHAKRADEELIAARRRWESERDALLISRAALEIDLKHARKERDQANADMTELLARA